MLKIGGEKKRNKVLALIMTFAVVATLFFIGPIRAEILEIFIDQSEIEIGDQLSFVVSMIIQKSDMNNVSYFVIDLEGPLSITCTFDPDGNKITSCVGIDILKLTNDTIDFDYNHGYGYGYGYCSGYGPCVDESRNLTFLISINTTGYPPGEYETNFIALTDNGVRSKQGGIVNLVEEGKLLESCSVRARDGNLYVDGINFGDSGKLNFNVPKSVAVNGKGTLIAQKNGNRLSYHFEVQKVLKNNDKEAIILVDGDYKIGRQNGFDEGSTLKLDKKNMKISINGTTINAQGMDINFMNGCEPR